MDTSLVHFFAAVGDLIADKHPSPGRSALAQFMEEAGRRIEESELLQREIDRVKATRFNVFHWIERGKRMEFGPMRNREKAKVKSRSAELLAAIQKIYPSARPWAWFEAAVRMRSPAADWSEPETLWRIHSDAGFLDGVAEQLLAVAKASEPILDRLAAKV